MPLTTVLVLTFLTAAAAPLVVRLLRGASGWVLAMMPFGMFIWALLLLSGSDGTPLTERLDWVPALDLSLSLRLDGLSMLFVLLITGIGTFIAIYGGGYLSGGRGVGRFYFFLFVFMAGMLGLVLSDNLVALFVFWELTSISSYFLIAHDHENAEARRSALQALLVTGAGGLALLAGFVLLGTVGGSYEIQELNVRNTEIRASAAYLPILVLVLLGAFTKSAQAPFHFWLPGAMAAPAPVSAYLHSATMVKAGIYLLARLTPLLGGTEAWHYLLTLAGAATLVAGAGMAFYQTDLKRLLAYSTVSALGMLVLLLGISTDVAAKAMLVFLLVHSLYKGALFMVAGTVDHEVGTRDVRELGGLLRVLPLTGTAAILAALSMTGFPPLLGFIGKELIYEAKMQAPSASLILLLAGVIANAATIAVALVVGIQPFLAERKKRPVHVHDGGVALWAGPLLMAAAGLLFGLFPDIVGTALIEPAVRAVRAEQLEVELKLWHGINPVFLLSVVTVLLGIGFFAIRHRARELAARWRWPDLATPQGVFRSVVDRLPGVAERLTRIFQNGNLRSYLLVVLVAVLALLLQAILRYAGPIALPPFSGVAAHEYVLIGLMLAATVGTLFARTRLAAVAGLGVVGYGVAVLYVLYSAPDLAITQILVETLTVVIFVLVVARLPQLKKRSSLPVRLRDGVIALAAGSAVTVLALLASTVQLRPTISDYYARNSLSEGFGRNVVNVILVDFRALDTLGEITVLAVAALGVFALLKLRASEPRASEPRASEPRATHDAGSASPPEDPR